MIFLVTVPVEVGTVRPLKAVPLGLVPDRVQPSLMRLQNIGVQAIPTITVRRRSGSFSTSSTFKNSSASVCARAHGNEQFKHQIVQPCTDIPPPGRPRWYQLARAVASSRSAPGRIFAAPGSRKLPGPDILHVVPVTADPLSDPC